MVLDALTPEELARQEKALARLRERILSSGSFAALGIGEVTERLVPGYAEMRWSAGIGEYRIRRWGGLEFAFSTEGAGFVVSVIHDLRDLFWVHIANDRGHTESIAQVPFEALGPFVWKQVGNCLRAHRESLERARAGRTA